MLPTLGGWEQGAATSKRQRGLTGGGADGEDGEIGGTVTIKQSKTRLPELLAYGRWVLINLRRLGTGGQLTGS